MNNTLAEPAEVSRLGAKVNAVTALTLAPAGPPVTIADFHVTGPGRYRLGLAELDGLLGTGVPGPPEGGVVELKVLPHRCTPCPHKEAKLLLARIGCSLAASDKTLATSNKIPQVFG